ncbi:tail assembly protein [Bibersteinia trehalosi]|uniref:tail assembly protein n=1 Tax=Bibersteinia trehalosi TaxID=47735 RepID=UPI002D76C65C|nr:tail assembly protein [Bibersteinia trehalosi]
MALITVRFYGSLKSFGEKFTLDVADTAEALRALFAQLPNLRQTIQRGFYKIRIGRNYLDNRYLEQGLCYQLKDGMTIHLTPVAKGAKKAGVFQTIAGAVLFIAGAVISVMSIGTASPLGGQMMLAGGAMMLGGVAQMLTKTPSMGGTGNDNEKKQSTSFSNIQNRAAQGQPVPLAYGRIRCGSMIISQGVETIDVELEQQNNRRR